MLLHRARAFVLADAAECIIMTSLMDGMSARHRAHCSSVFLEACMGAPAAERASR